MAMVPEDLKNAWVKNLKSIDNPKNALKVFSSTLKDYLENNMIITYSWVGISSIPTTDPIVSFTAKISWNDFNIINPKSFILFGSLITNELLKGEIKPVDSSFSLTLGKLKLVTPFILVKSFATTQDIAMLNLATQIIIYVKTMIDNTTVLTGSHGIYISSPGAVMLSIL